MRARGLAACAALAGILAAPTVAQGATLVAASGKPCYGTGDGIGLRGAGFTPNDEVRVSRDGRAIGRIATDSRGAFSGRVSAPAIDVPAREARYVAADGADPAIRATLRLRLSSLRVRVMPTDGDPGRPRRINARGFTRGKVLWAHVVRGRTTRSVRVGRLRGACRKIARRLRIFRRGTPTGRYRVQFDTFRRYRRGRDQRVAFDVRIFRVGRPAAAGAGERWVRVY